MRENGSDEDMIDMVNIQSLSWHCQWISRLKASFAYCLMGNTLWDVIGSTKNFPKLVRLPKVVYISHGCHSLKLGYLNS